MKILLVAKHHFLIGLEGFFLPGLEEAKRQLPEDSRQREFLEIAEKKIEKERKSVSEKLS